MTLPFRLLFRKSYRLFMDFKDRAYSMTSEEFEALYAETQKFNLHPDTDLNAPCEQRIHESIVGDSVLEVGCGRFYLSERIASRGHQVTATDINDYGSSEIPKGIHFVRASAEKLPFPDQSFDTVVSCHTLEHLLNPASALAELRRVCRKRVIIVLPCQRPSKFNFSLHIQFYPYEFSVRSLVGAAGHYELLGGDHYYQEDLGQS